MTVWSFVCFPKETLCIEARMGFSSLSSGKPNLFYTCRKKLHINHIHYWRGIIDLYLSFWFGSAWAMHLLVYTCLAAGNTGFRLQSSSFNHWKIGEKSCTLCASVPNIVLVMERNQFVALQSPSLTESLILPRY